MFKREHEVLGRFGGGAQLNHGRLTAGVTKQWMVLIKIANPIFESSDFPDDDDRSDRVSSESRTWNDDERIKPQLSEEDAVPNEKAIALARVGLGGSMSEDFAARIHADVGTVMAELFRAQEVGVSLEQRGLYGRSLGVLAADNSFRVLCSDIVSHKCAPPGSTLARLFHGRAYLTPWFCRLCTGFILVLIFINTVILAIQGPNNDLDARTHELFNLFDLVVTVVFTVEMMLRIIALGFVRGPRTYLKDSWNVRAMTHLWPRLLEVIACSCSCSCS